MTKAEKLLNVMGLNEALDEKIVFFADLLKKRFGLKMKINKKRDKVYEFICYANGIEIGVTTLTLEAGTFKDILFGSSSGMFTAQEVQQVKRDIEKLYDKKFKVSGKPYGVKGGYKGKVK